MSGSGLLFLLILVVLLASIIILFWHPQRSRTSTSISTDRERTPFVFRDDERYWYAGYFYNNPDDPALFVPKRYGLGWTLNFGHPRSTLFLIGMLLVLLLLLALPVLLSSGVPTGCHSFGCQP